MSTKSITVSHSQLETFARCPRAWWFDKVVRVPRQPKRSQIKGSAMHRCLENYLGGADDEKGIFSPGWYKSKEGTLTTAEQTQVINAVKALIDQNVVRRRPGQRIEHKFRDTLGDHIWMLGYIDVMNTPVGELTADPSAWEIEDHKSTSSDRYLKSDKTLSNDLQMARYAHAVWLYAAQKGVQLEDIPVRHNQAVWDGKVSCATGIITKERRLEVNEQSRALANEIFDLSNSGIAKISQWNEVEQYRQPDACKAFGGCPYQEVCTMSMNADRFLDRFNQPEPTPTEEWGNALKSNASVDQTAPDMSDFNPATTPPPANPAVTAPVQNNLQPGGQTPPPEAVAAAAQEAQTAQANEITNLHYAAQGVVAEKAPWGISIEGVDTCGTCHGYGYFLGPVTSKGGSYQANMVCPECRIESVQGKRLGAISSFDLELNPETGRLGWRPKEAVAQAAPAAAQETAAAPAVQPAAQPTAPVQAAPTAPVDVAPTAAAAPTTQPTTAETAPAAAPAATPAPTPAPAEVSGALEAETPSAEPKKGRRKQLELHYGVLQIEGPASCKSDLDLLEIVWKHIDRDKLLMQKLYDQKQMVHQTVLAKAADFQGNRFFISARPVDVVRWACEALEISGYVTVKTAAAAH